MNLEAVYDSTSSSTLDHVMWFLISSRTWVLVFLYFLSVPTNNDSSFKTGVACQSAWENKAIDFLKIFSTVKNVHVKQMGYPWYWRFCCHIFLCCVYYCAADAAVGWKDWRSPVLGAGSEQERHFNFFLGGANFIFIFQCHWTIEKLEKTALYM